MTRRLAVLAILLFPYFLAAQPADAPLPDTQQLKQRALISLKESEKQLEKYSCVVRSETDELTGNGSVKRHRTKELERFYVNGVEIDHTLQTDGRPLSSSEAKHEQQRVDADVRKFSDPRQLHKAQVEDEKETDLFLRALRFTDGRREIRSGRSTVVYALRGDPEFHARHIEERFAQALSGRIWIDEQSGNPVEVQVETKRDVKIAGGLLATVHKGFQLHLIQQMQPDGVWLTSFVAGSGDVRAALFLHPRFRFKEQLDKCHLFSVETEQTVEKPDAAPVPKP